MAEKTLAPSTKSESKVATLDKEWLILKKKIRTLPEAVLKSTLTKNNLDCRGILPVLRTRVRLNAYNDALLRTGEPKPASMYSFLLIVDFEATCEESNPPDYQHEIIEFPVILYDAVLMRTIDTFHAYCQPQINPKLSHFCSSLTNIKQATIDTAYCFPEVLSQMEDWMVKHRLYEHSFAVVTDCDADMAKFMRLQCAISGLPVPEWALQWINLRLIFPEFYALSTRVSHYLNLKRMLHCVGLQFEGRTHSGLDDAVNIVRIVEILLKDHCNLQINEKLSANSPPFYTAKVI